MDNRKPIAVRDFNFSDGTLEQLSDYIKLLIIRDEPQLAHRGITAATASNLGTLISVFKNLPTDIETRGDVSVQVDIKETARNKVLIQARSLRTAAQNVFGMGAPKYNRFRFEGMDKLRDEVFYRHMRSIHRVGLDLQSHLLNEGIDATFMTNFLNLITAFDAALENIDIAIEQRDKATDERCTAGNILYKEIVRLCNIGKDVFGTISEAQYNDYVIDNFVRRSTSNE